MNAATRSALSGSSVRRTSQNGFSLIELMIVVVIIGVLAMIAYPSYEQHVLKTRRANVAACLLERAQLLERFYTTTLSYLNPPAVAQCPEVAAFYNVTLTSVTATTYQLNAAPLGRQLARDTLCGTLSLDQAGVRGKTGSGTAAQCWQ